MNTNTKVATLVFSGLSMFTGELGYTPTPKAKPGNSFIETNYLSPKNMLGRTVFVKDLDKSEKRRQILKDIRNTREEMKKLAAKSKTQKLFAEQMQLDNDLVNLFQRITIDTHRKVLTAIKETAQEHNLPEKFVPEAIALENKGMLVIDLEIA